MERDRSLEDRALVLVLVGGAPNALVVLPDFVAVLALAAESVDLGEVIALPLAAWSAAALGALAGAGATIAALAHLLLRRAGSLPAARNAAVRFVELVGIEAAALVVAGGLLAAAGHGAVDAPDRPNLAGLVGAWMLLRAVVPAVVWLIGRPLARRLRATARPPA